MLKASNALTLALLLGGAACHSPHGAGTWNARINWEPTGAQLKSAAYSAVTDPWTWVPAAGFVLLSFDDHDENLAELITENRVFFGSRSNAREWAEDLVTASRVVATTASLAPAAGDDVGDWLTSKLQVLVVQFSAQGATAGLSSDLNTWTRRPRPDGSDRKSFPSQDVAASSFGAAWARGTLPLWGLDRSAHDWTSIGLGALPFATAMANIEGEQHYPTDVLAGAALGNFLTRLIQDMFLEEAGPGEPLWTVTTLDGEVQVGVRWSF